MEKIDRLTREPHAEFGVPWMTAANLVAVPEAQRASREAVLSEPLFPDLERRLISVFGPTAEAIMLHQLCYWFSREKMRNRWSLYITFDGWYEQRGLNRKQVDKGRKRLKPTGIVQESYGNYKRIHYALDWVRLAHRIRIDLPKGGTVGPAAPEGGTVGTGAPEGGAVLSATPSGQAAQGGQTHRNRINGTPEGAVGGGRSNARDYAKEHAEDYLTKNTSTSSLQDWDMGRPSIARPRGNAHHRPWATAEEAHPSKLSGQVKNRAYGEMFGLVGDGEAKRLVERYLEGEDVSLEQVAAKLREKVGGAGSIQAHAEWAKYCFDTLGLGPGGTDE